MAFTQKNNFAIGDADIEELMTWADVVAVGGGSVSLTEMNTTTVPAIAAGSWIECGGATYESATETAISTTDPVTGTTVADGTIYVVLIPGTSTITAAFTATAPTWNDSYQGWYGTGSYAAYKYLEKLGVPIKITKSSSAYWKRFGGRRIHPVVSASLPGSSGTSDISNQIVAMGDLVDLHNEVGSSEIYIKVPGLYNASVNLLMTINSSGASTAAITGTVTAILQNNRTSTSLGSSKWSFYKPSGTQIFYNTMTIDRILELSYSDRIGVYIYVVTSTTGISVAWGGDTMSHLTLEQII